MSLSRRRWLREQLKWWQSGVLDSDEKRMYGQKVGLVGRVAGLIRSWPVALTPETWEAESLKLQRQHYISDRSSSPQGGWLEYLSQLIHHGPEGLVRPDAFTKWRADPVRAAVKEMRDLNMRLTLVAANKLARRHGVTGARDLVARRRALAAGGPSGWCLLVPALSNSSRRWRQHADSCQNQPERPSSRRIPKDARRPRARSRRARRTF